MSNYLSQTLELLKKDFPQFAPVGLSSRLFTSESNTILEAQNNTIIKLLTFTLERLDNLEELIAKIHNKAFCT